MDFFETAKKIFNLDEGIGLPDKEGKPYPDSKGFWTIGRGHLIGKYISDLKLSPHVIDEIFREDLDKATKEAISIIGVEKFIKLTLARKFALISMLFTLGETKFEKFHETIAAIKNEDWDLVASRVLQTKWAVDVDPQRRENKGRDDRIAYMFRVGEFHPDYKIKDPK